ncbi:hypothetical protein BC828DRAFT_393442 [Blastocladiella britannica]|nr:hypothetical protein BC828DRAFT_393442 [Blastocladiella britannica]
MASTVAGTIAVGLLCFVAVYSWRKDLLHCRTAKPARPHNSSRSRSLPRYANERAPPSTMSRHSMLSPSVVRQSLRSPSLVSMSRPPPPPPPSLRLIQQQQQQRHHQQERRLSVMLPPPPLPPVVVHQPARDNAVWAFVALTDSIMTMADAAAANLLGIPAAWRLGQLVVQFPAPYQDASREQARAAIAKALATAVFGVYWSALKEMPKSLWARAHQDGRNAIETAAAADDATGRPGVPVTMEDSAAVLDAAERAFRAVVDHNAQVAATGTGERIQEQWPRRGDRVRQGMVDVRFAGEMATGRMRNVWTAVVPGLTVISTGLPPSLSRSPSAMSNMSMLSSPVSVMSSASVLRQDPWLAPPVVWSRDRW